MILHWVTDLGCQDLPEVSRDKSTACAEACPTRLRALAQVEGFAFHTAAGWSEDHQSTWWAAWSSGHRSGGHTEPGQASSGPGDTADICIYSPWALTALWGGTLVRWWHSPRISEPFFSINLVGDPAKWQNYIRAAHRTENIANVLYYWNINKRFLTSVGAKFKFLRSFSLLRRG